MIKMIKPIVNFSKIADKYNTVILGLRGVLTDGQSIKKEAVEALINMKKRNMHIFLLSNTYQRVETVIRFLYDNNVPIAVFEGMMTAGEAIHYQLKAQNGEFSRIGHKYFKLGKKDYKGIFHQLTNYQETSSLAQADFAYIESIANSDDTIDTYIPLLEHASSLNMPLICVGNDTSTYHDGKIILGTGALAEQYAVLGGKIITYGKPDVKLFAYMLDNLTDIKKDKVLVIGDSLQTDIKGAKLLNVDSLLISKGVHVNFLGEGYIPDVAKTRELAANYDVSPDYVISNLRW
ncbi:MAG: TIGR01459 family HAD-type hydrolase [Alphaproteobacteria bacterium]|nr:TIGR01459 family HAD-type hydrolase [Alphaproteobacteria bacterium]